MESQAMRLSTYDKPRVIACGQEFPQHIAVPRGCLTETLALLTATRYGPKFGTNGVRASPIEAEFQGQLRELQEEAVKDHRPRRRHSLRSDGIRENRSGGVADRETEGQHSGRGSPAAVARSVAGAPWDVLGCPPNRSGISAVAKSTGRVAWTSPSSKACTERTK